jgi:hypothetical protein
MQINQITEEQFKKSVSKTSSKTNPLINQKPPINPPSVDGTGDTMFIERLAKEGATEFNRLSLPSRGFFYKKKTPVSYRKLKIKDLVKLRLYIEQKSITYLIDAIQNCISPNFNGEVLDVRDLTIDDFIFLTTDLLINSYPGNIEYSKTWTSFYGNTNSHHLIKITDLIIEDLDYKTLQEKLPELTSLPFIPLTVRSYEIIQEQLRLQSLEEGSAWSEDKLALYTEFACYINKGTPEEQLQFVEDLELASPEYEKLTTFIQYSKHGIKDEILVTDKLFEPNPAISYLEKRLEELNTLSTTDYESLLLQTNKALGVDKNFIQKEIDRLRNALTTGQEVKALEELIPFRFRLDDFIFSLYLAK